MGPSSAYNPEPSDLAPSFPGTRVRASGLTIPDRRNFALASQPKRSKGPSAMQSKAKADEPSQDLRSAAFPSGEVASWSPFLLLFPLTLQKEAFLPTTEVDGTLPRC